LAAANCRSESLHLLQQLLDINMERIGAYEYGSL